MNARLLGFLTLGVGLIIHPAGLVPSCLSGQDKVKPHVAIPEAGEVSSIKFAATKFFPGGPFDLNLTKPEEIKPLAAWLKDVGWDYAKSGNAQAIKFAQRASITIAQKDKADLSFSVTEKMIIADDRFWAADTKKLEDIIKQIRAQGK